MTSISVIMAAHNAASTIEASIRSVLRARPAVAELLIWDDGSTDTTREVVAGVRDTRIRLFGDVEQVGSGRARRELVRRATHDIIAINDADDITFPWRFARTVRHLQQADFVCTSAVRFGDQFRLLRPAAVMPVRPADFPVALLIHNPIVHSSVIGRKEAFERAGSYSDLRRGQDYELWLRAAAADLRFKHLLTPTVGYRQTASQVSRSVGYHEAVTRAPAIASAWTDLRNHVRTSSDQHRGRLRGSEADPGLSEPLRSMPALTRAYYRRLLVGMG